VTPPSPDEPTGISEALRSAIESTFAATAGSAGETRERAAELLDEVVKRGGDARDELVRRGREAGEGVVRKGQDAGADVVARVEEELRSISERLAKLESSLRGKS
jgi:polyhydroxyalkanoate synthesis regulator phasin